MTGYRREVWLVPRVGTTKTMSAGKCTVNILGPAPERAHGVYGACTELIDDATARACIALSGALDRADVPRPVIDNPGSFESVAR